MTRIGSLSIAILECRRSIRCHSSRLLAAEVKQVIPNTGGLGEQQEEKEDQEEEAVQPPTLPGSLRRCRTAT